MKAEVSAVHTPMMRQYLAIKAEYPDMLVFYRMGDFYEMFFEDAETASRVLGITLTSRNKGDKNQVPMCGVPYHAVSGYLSKMVKAGYRVAICEQAEDPKQAKGIVKREITEIITPGLVSDPESLQSSMGNYLLALSREGSVTGLAFIDISTGEFRTTEVDDQERLAAELERTGSSPAARPSSTS